MSKKSLTDEQIRAVETRTEITSGLKDTYTNLKSSVEKTNEPDELTLTKIDATRILFVLKEYMNYPMYPPGSPPDPDKPDGDVDSPGDLFNTYGNQDPDDVSVADNSTGDPF